MRLSFPFLLFLFKEYFNDLVILYLVLKKRARFLNLSCTYLIWGKFLNLHWILFLHLWSELSCFMGVCGEMPHTSLGLNTHESPSILKAAKLLVKFSSYFKSLHLLLLPSARESAVLLKATCVISLKVHCAI